MIRFRLFFFICFIFIGFSLNAKNSLYPIQGAEDIKRIFPKNQAEMLAFKENSLREDQILLERVKRNAEQNKEFLSFLKQFDEFLTVITTQTSIAEVLTLVALDEDLRKEALNTELAIRGLFDDIFINETGIYEYIKEARSHLDLSSEINYFVDELIFKFDSNGQSLALNDRLKVQKLNKEISLLEQLFGKNIQEDNSYIQVKKKDLKGVHKEVYENLQEDESGFIELSCSGPLYSRVMSTCESEEVRKRYAELRSNRAFPSNESVLKDLIHKRDELAKILGYPSFAHLRLKSEMCNTPERAASFLTNLWTQSAKKESDEFKALTENLPLNTSLTKEGQLNSWDINYVYNSFKQRAFDLNHETISEYFPIETTTTALMNIYQRFFNLKISEEPIHGLWDEDVKLLKVAENNDEVLGYILLDLFPRKNKFTHACNASIIPGPIVDGKKYPALEVVITNFPTATDDKPALLKHQDVITFFHEFGHAIHSILIRNEIHYFSNISHLKYDFIELPSQLLEEWLWDPEILKIVSSHYKTKEPLSDYLIEKMVQSKNSFSGYFVQSQCYISFLALNLFSEGKNKDPTLINRELTANLQPNYMTLDNSHFQLSFEHLTDYGPVYYGYLWSRVFSLDIFEQIKAQGLMNPLVGEKYRREILEKGGAVDPNILLKNFLGREPNQEAFIRSLGL